MKVFYRASGYTDGALRAALLETFGEYEITDDPVEARLQLADYEDLDFQAALDDGTKWICAYSIRKALIRKHFLSQTVREYIAKNPKSVLTRAVPETWNLEVDYVEFLDDALDESFELRGELELNESRDPIDRKWYILKPGMAERGAGLRLFSTIAELTVIFEENEPQSDGEADEEVDGSRGDDQSFYGSSTSDKRERDSSPHNGVMTSDMRFFVVQEYLASPLLLPALERRKFHVRAYVLCLGSLQVYIHKNLLVLSSAVSYEPPTFDTLDLSRHLTNTCYQLSSDAKSTSDTVHAFWQIEDPLFRKEDVWAQLKDITGQLFDAASSQRINFQTLPNAFEIFGLDFLVDRNNKVSLLEVNAYPDFAQTGSSLRSLVDAVSRDMIGLVGSHMRAGHTTASTGLEEEPCYGGFDLCLSKRMLS